MASALLPAVIRSGSAQHTATVIFLHGLGDTGHGWSEVGKMLGGKLPHVKFIFPHAPHQPVTLNGGMRMPSWYDIKSLGAIDQEQDEQGMLASSHQVNQFIQSEIDAGIPANRIVVGGFSQGCAVTLLTMLRSERTLGGLISLSGYLPLHNKILNQATDQSRATPIFWGHGLQDDIVRYSLGTMSRDLLEKAGYKVQFNTYQNMGHSSCNEEITAFGKFLAECIPQTTTSS